MIHFSYLCSDFSFVFSSSGYEAPNLRYYKIASVFDIVLVGFAFVHKLRILVDKMWMCYWLQFFPFFFPSNAIFSYKLWVIVLVQMNVLELLIVMFFKGACGQGCSFRILCCGSWLLLWRSLWSLSSRQIRPYLDQRPWPCSFLIPFFFQLFH